MEIVTDLIRSVLKQNADKKTECNAHFAIHMGNLMRQPDQYRLVFEWVSSLSKSTFASAFGDVIELMVEIPMILGLTCLVFDPNQRWDFQGFRTMVHNMCIWQLCLKMGVETLDAKVHKVLEIHREFVPSAIALCVFVNDYDKKSHMKPLVSYLLHTLDPVIRNTNSDHQSGGELDMKRYFEIMHYNMQDQMAEASTEVVTHMIEMERMMGDLAIKEDATLVEHSLRRIRETKKDEPNPLNLQLLFVDHTELEQVALIQQLADAMHFAMLCTSKPSDSSMKCLKATLDRLSNDELMQLTHVLNRLTATEVVSDAVLQSLFHAVERKLDSVDLMDSPTVSMLNMTVHSNVSGRWRDVLGNLLQKDESSILTNHGKDAHVLEETHAMQLGLHRLMFITDMYKLFSQQTVTTKQYEGAVILTFYTQEGLPVFFARTCASSYQELPRIIHQWYDELRLYNRITDQSDQSEQQPATKQWTLKDGFILDESTMSPYEITLRTYVNDVMKQHLDTSSISEPPSSVASPTATSTAIRLVQQDHTNLLQGCKPQPLDTASIQYFQEIQRLKRVTNFKEWQLPYKLCTGCSMRVILWQGPALQPLSPVNLVPDVMQLIV